MSKRSAKRKKHGRQPRKSGGGTMTGFRHGLKSFVGSGPKKKESTLSKVISYLLLAAAIALLIYRFTR